MTGLLLAILLLPAPPLDGCWQSTTDYGCELGLYVFEPTPRRGLYRMETYTPTPSGYIQDGTGTARLTGPSEMVTCWNGGRPVVLSYDPVARAWRSGSWGVKMVRSIQPR